MPWIRSLLAVALLLVAGTAWAEDWPSKPVRMVVPVAAGSSNDIAARKLADGLGAIWGRGVVVENFAGAGGVRGLRELVQAAPDGYTIGMIPASTLIVSPIVYKKENFDPDRQLVPVAPVFETPFAIAANPTSGIASIADLQRLAKAEPGKIGISVLPLNTAVQLAAVMLDSAAGIDMLIVPYRTPGEAVLSAVRGDTKLTLGGVVTMAGMVKAGSLRFVAVTSRKRMPGFDVPTVGETIPGFAASSWGALFAPAGTPPAVVAKISADTQKVLADPAINSVFAAGGIYPTPGTTADLIATIKADRPGWERAARAANKLSP